MLQGFDEVSRTNVTGREKRSKIQKQGRGKSAVTALLCLQSETRLFFFVMLFKRGRNPDLSGENVALHFISNRDYVSSSAALLREKDCQ